MIRCLACDEPLRDDPERMGARCPRCRQPLYEDPRHAIAQYPGSAEASHCVVHTRSAAVGTCERCGNFLCAVCRTRWRNQVLCVACIERALESKEATPAEARAHLRQSILAIVFGGVAWFGTVLSMVMMIAGFAGNEPNIGLVGLGVLLLLATPLPGLLGIGQAASAIRARGDHMIMATIGLILSGLHTGIVLGLFTFALLQNR
ncbi:MAG: hypothetical protein K2R98_14395 [Gemmataceae bacterium]|nr:hypothetical protein [Gemmataceae bacterium]